MYMSRLQAGISCFASHPGMFGALMVVLLGAGVLLPSQAAERGEGDGDPRCDASVATLRKGIAALEDDDDPDRAVQLLRSVVSMDPGCYSEAHGSAAYWLGMASGQAGNSSQQRAAWEKGIAAVIGSERPLDGRLADAYIHRVFSAQRGGAYPQAVRAYLALIELIGSRPLAPWERPILARQLRLVAVLLPPAVRARTGLEGEITPSSISSLPAHCGRDLVAWWRGLDPLPATPANERLEEHLERVAHAQSHFEKDGRIDERGEIYVRLGAPSRQTSVQFNSIRFHESALSFDSRFSMADFKPGQFWVYDDVSRATQYLFVKQEQGKFEIGDVISMLPQSLQRGFSSSYRGQEAAAVFIRAMAEAYSQLAVYHDRYHSLNQRLSNYSLDLDAGTTGSVMRGNRTALNFARRTLLDVKQSDIFHRQQRERNTPRVHSRRLDEHRAIPVAVRHARFLRPNGTTRVEVYWSAPYNELADVPGTTLPGQYLISTSIVLRGDEGRPLTTRYRSNAVEAGRKDRRAFLRPQRHQLIAHPEQSFRLDLQWDQYEADAGRAVAGEMVGRYVWQSDTLHSLSPNREKLLLSDIRPMVVPPGTQGEAVDKEALPYPFAQINPDMTLVLYFEAYHLAFTGEDRTRYSIEYEVRRQENDGRLVRLFTDDDPRSTATEATYEGGSRTAKEYIMIDLSDWEGSDDLRVTVRVTDEATGQQVERSVDLEAAGR